MEHLKSRSILNAFICLYYLNSFVFCRISDMSMSEPFNTANLKLKKPSGTSGISNDHWDRYEKLCR